MTWLMALEAVSTSARSATSCIIALVLTFSSLMTLLIAIEASAASRTWSLLPLVIKTSVCLLEGVCHGNVVLLTVVFFIVATTCPSSWRSCTLVFLFYTSVISPLLIGFFFTCTSLTSTKRLRYLCLNIAVTLLLVSAIVTVNRATTSSPPVSLITLFAWCFLDLWNCFDAWPWRFLTSEMTLVVLSLPIFFEPVYKIHEWRQVLFMEVKTFWPHLDKLFYNLFFRKIG